MSRRALILGTLFALAVWVLCILGLWRAFRP